MFSSNGDGFVFHDRTGRQRRRSRRTSALDAFPSPADLWARYRAWKGLDAGSRADRASGLFRRRQRQGPRYYQVNAVNAAIEAIAKGRDRILLVMATGTGKTYTAFQIIWRLVEGGPQEAHPVPRRPQRADRPDDGQRLPPVRRRRWPSSATGAKTIETYDGTDRPTLPPLSTQSGAINTSYEIYLGLYQAITGPEERQKLFREFSPGFFDLIVIDECHRGSAAEDSAWREILEYFSSPRRSA